MRPNNQNNKNRQRGRNGGRKHVNPLSRNFESNGPDVKVRGNAAHIAEKYLQLARDAQSSGDSVMAENYLQHAEHYFRIVSSAQQAQNGQRPEGQDDDFDDDMPDMNSRFASPQPPPQQQYVQAEGEEQAGEGEQGQGQPRQDGERQQRGDRRDRQRNRERFRPEGEVQQPVSASEEAQPVAATEAVEASGEQPVEAEGEARKPRERRPRRRRPAGGDSGDLAGADQPDVGELPAFLTAGSTAAE
ncbi:DUF4167 domain-containing protein [Devosia ginsengisoli]|uniref:DUF4167 domain-containing protein n=1 Tax=Devosia ginsengisoli TaxID=400770 RepID=A0A5B8LVR0_9HYPH|nr:DUF4167 domain-containing protein [Devosia ginsengisoli]QDZ11694.1 DUF4167 domain-containing protein [Devosia ginsengisoli]